MKRRTVLSLEQALSLPYATLRFVQLGWRVIRIEAAPSGKGLPGDPNRYIGSRVFDDDRRSYFIAPNVGKEAIALDLKSPEGQAILRSLIRELDVEIFCCNTLPSRYKTLGIDYASLAAVRPDLIWAGISAMGPEYPDVPGYDPGVQAMAGYMELTGYAAGPPTLAGVPIIDLKAGDELFAHVCLALAERAETGKGKEIHVSMLQAAASWLITTLPLLDFDCDPSEVTRCGNEHRKFVPTNAYPTRDGFVLVAVGNDIQWQRLCAIPRFAALASATRNTMEGRTKERQVLHRGIAAVTAACTTAELVAELGRAGIVHAVINTIPQVRALPAIDSRLTTTYTPDGNRVRMQPPAVDIAGAPTEFRFPARYGEHTRAVLREAGCMEAELAALSKAGTIAG